MTSLSQIVLPLPESRSLVEKGIKLDTAMVWFVMTEGSFCQKVFPIGEVPYDPGVSYELVSAPTLSELLDAIYARYDNAEITMYGSGLIDEWIGKEAHQQNEDTDLLAAYALLMEVAK